MFSFRSVLLVTASAFLLVAAGGCGIFGGNKWEDSEIKGPEPKAVGSLPQVSGGMVLPVNSEIITVDEVVRPMVDELSELAAGRDYLDFRAKAKSTVTQTVSNRISNIVLYQKAKREAREDIDEQLEKAAKEEVKKFVAGFDGNAALAERAIAKMGMNWKTFLDYQKRLLMVQAYLAEEFKEDKNPVTYTDLVSYYDRIKDDDYRTPVTVQFRLIDIMPALVTPIEPNQTRLARAKQICEEVMTKIKRGEDFGELAKQYSADKIKGAQGGMWSPIGMGSLAKPYDKIEQECLKIKPGQIAGPIDTGDHMFIVKLENKQDQSYEPFEKVQHKVEVSIRFQRRREAIDSLTTKLMAQADVGDKEGFVEQCLQRGYQLVKN